MSVLWLGPRASDLTVYDPDACGVALIGPASETHAFKTYEAETKHRLNNNTQEANDVDQRFFREKISTDCPDLEKTIVPYNPLIKQRLPEYLGRQMCTPNLMLVSLLNNKYRTRTDFLDTVRAAPFVKMRTADLQWHQIKSHFPQSHSFVIQELEGTGGHQTWFLRSPADLSRISWSHKDHVIVSPILEPSIPVNQHAFVATDHITVSPLSIQLISESPSGQPLFVGSDFAASQFIPENIKRRVAHVSREVASRIQQQGYRGILGIDYLIYEDSIYFVEVNPKSQASTSALALSLPQNTPSPLHAHVATFNDGRPTPVEEYLETFWSVLTPLNTAKNPVHVDRNFLEKIKRLSDALSTSVPCRLVDVPEHGTRIDPGAPIFRVFQETAVCVTDGDTIRFTDFAQSVINGF